MLVLERDDFDGDAAVTKRIYRVNLRRTDRSGQLAKTLVVDLLKLDNPDRHRRRRRLGHRRPVQLRLQSVETLVPLPDGRLADRQRQQLPRQRGPPPGHARTTPR